MFLIYDFIFFIYSLVYLPYALLTRRLYKGFEQRFGFLPESFCSDARPAIWVHAVSVGEVMVAGPFIRRLQEKYPSHRIVFSVTTKTGYALAHEKLSSQAQVIAAPLDFSFITKRFVDSLKPKIYIALETEIWPNLFSQLHNRRIPIVIVNGRISDGSFPRYQLIKGVLNSILSRVNLFCMQSPLDAQRIEILGAQASRVKVTGNMKFDGVIHVKSGNSPYFANNNQCWWVAGSTHPGEEEILLDVYAKLRGQFPLWRLIIAPRHIERSAQLMDLITAKGFKAKALSRLEGALEVDDILLVDTMGQLRSLYALSSLVFVGKSLCGGGGQNMIEPSAFAKPVIIGTRTENFRDVMACFKNEQAIIQVNDEVGLEAAVRDLMADENRRLELGVRAKGVVESNQGATERTLNDIAVFLK